MRHKIKNVTKENISREHKKIIDERIKKIEEGKEKFKNWDEIKKKYIK